MLVSHRDTFSASEDVAIVAASLRAARNIFRLLSRLEERVIIWAWDSLPDGQVSIRYTVDRG